jgi:hypothetical protein
MGDETKPEEYEPPELRELGSIAELTDRIDGGSATDSTDLGASGPA